MGEAAGMTVDVRRRGRRVVGEVRVRVELEAERGEDAGRLVREAAAKVLLARPRGRRPGSTVPKGLELTCQRCHRTFRASRGDAKFCSSSCRALFHRYGPVRVGVRNPLMSYPGDPVVDDDEDVPDDAARCLQMETHRSPHVHRATDA